MLIHIHAPMDESKLSINFFFSNIKQG